MKVTKIAGTSTVAALVGLTFGVATSAHATLSPIASNATDLLSSTAGVVGWATPNANGGSDEAQIAQDMLYLNNGGSSSSMPYPISGETFNNNTAGTGGAALSYGGGTVENASANVTGNLSNPVASGYEFVIAKYGGPGGGGYILFYLGGNSIELPQLSYALWGKSNQYGISDYTEFDVSGNTAVSQGDTSPIPEPSTVFAASLLLIPFGMSTLRVLRKSSRA